MGYKQIDLPGGGVMFEHEGGWQREHVRTAPADTLPDVSPALEWFQTAPGVSETRTPDPATGLMYQFVNLLTDEPDENARRILRELGWDIVFA